MDTLPKLIPAGRKRRNNKQQTQLTINDQSQQWKHSSKKWNVVKFYKKETRTTSTVSLLLTLSLLLRIRVPLLLTLNIFHFLHDVKYAKIPALHRKKERKVLSLIDCDLKCFTCQI